MKNTSPKLFCAFLVIAALLGSPTALKAQGNEPPRILFLHLKIKGQTISLVNATSVPGVLKPAPAAQGDIRYEIISTNGAALWQGALADPRGELPDFPALDNSDKTPRQRPPVPDELDFTLRIPHQPAAQRINFYAIAPRQGAASPNAHTVKKLLGSLPLNNLSKPAR